MIPPPLRPARDLGAEASQAAHLPPRAPEPQAEDASFFGFATRQTKLPTISEETREVDGPAGDPELPEAFHHPEKVQRAAEPEFKFPPAPQPKGKPKLRAASETLAAAAPNAEVEEPEFKLPPPPPVPKSKPKLRPPVEEAPAPDPPVSPERAARRAKFAEEVAETVVIPSRWEAPGSKLTGSHERAQQQAAALGAGPEPSWAGLATPAQGDLEVVKVQREPTNRFRMSDTPSGDGLPQELRSSAEWRPAAGQGPPGSEGAVQPAVPSVEAARADRTKVAPRIAPGSSSVRQRSRGSYRAEIDASTTASSSDAVVSF